MKTQISKNYKKSYSIVAATETLGQQKYIKHQKMHKRYIFWSRIILFIGFLLLWQAAANFSYMTLSTGHF